MDTALHVVPMSNPSTIFDGLCQILGCHQLRRTEIQKKKSSDELIHLHQLLGCKRRERGQRGKVQREVARSRDLFVMSEWGGSAWRAG